MTARYPFTSRLTVLAQAVLFAATVSPAMAAGSDTSIERITTTATRTETSAFRQSFSVSAVDENALTLLSATHIEEALNQIAGAQLQRGNGQEYLPALRSPVFSGAGACGGLLTAEDGIPLRAAGFCNINELFEAHSEMAQRIEVLKGPGSVLYGSNAVHGVINVITPDTTRGGGMAGVDYGSYGYSRYKLRSGYDAGHTGAGINASVTRDTGYRVDEGVDQEKVNLRHRYDGNAFSVNSGLTYTNLEQDTAGYISGTDSYKDKALAQGNENPEAYRNARSLRLWSKVSLSLANGDDIIVTPFVRDQDMDFLMHFLPGQPVEQNSQRGAGIQSLWRHGISDNITLRTGIDGEFTEGDLLQYQDGATTGSAFLIETIPSGKHYDYSVDATVVAPFAMVNWEYGRWAWSAGARYEHIRYDYTNNMNSGRVREDGTACGMGGCRYTRPESREDTFSNFSPKLGAAYSIDENTLVYTNISRGYRAPQATELYRLQRAQTVAELKPEVADNIELGLKGKGGSLRYNIAVYHMDKDNFIYRDSDYYYVNNGKSRHVGAEVELEWQMNPEWALIVAGTVAKHTYRHSELSGDIDIRGNDMDTAPRHVANTQLRYTPTETITAELAWQHMGSYYTDPENAHKYDGHDVVDLRTSWDISPALTVYGRINNLFDEAYAERADYTSFSGDRYFPGRPRNYMISLVYRWE